MKQQCEILSSELSADLNNKMGPRLRDSRMSSRNLRRTLNPYYVICNQLFASRWNDGMEDGMDH